MTSKMDGSLRAAWRTAAIYRCCRRYGKDRIWAMGRIRELAPNGSRDHLINNWFYDIDRLSRRHAAERETARMAAHGPLRIAA